MHCFLVAIEGIKCFITIKQFVCVLPFLVGQHPTCYHEAAVSAISGRAKKSLNCACLGELTANMKYFKCRSNRWSDKEITHRHAFFHTVFFGRFVYLVTHKLNAAIDLTSDFSVTSGTGTIIWITQCCLHYRVSLYIFLLEGLCFYSLILNWSWTLQSYSIIWNRAAHATTMVSRDTRFKS